MVCKSAGQESLLYDPATDSVHVLNATARTIWDLCDGRHTAAGIEAALHARFARTEGQDVVGDLSAIIGLFEAEGLIAQMSGKEG